MGAILTPAAVRSIRTAVLDDPAATLAGLSREYGVHQETVASAVYGRTWRAVTDPGPLPPRPATGRRPANARLTPGKVRAARRRWLAGEPLSEIATRYGVSEAATRSAIHGLSWAEVTNPGPVPIRQVGGRTRALGDAQVRQAREMRAAGATWAEVGAALGVHGSQALRAVRRVEQAGT